MNLPRRVAWNTVSQAGARIVTLGLAVLTTFLLTRHLGVSGYGVYVTVTVYVPFFALFFDAGITTYVLRALSQGVSRSDLYREALGLRIAIALAATALAFVLAVGLYSGTTLKAIAIGLPMILFASTGAATSVLFQSRLQMDRVA